MIIEDIICQIEEAVQQTGLVNAFFPYCEKITRGEISYPAQYTKGGEYLPVYDFDVNGSGYIRKNGDVKVEVANIENMTACETLTLIKYTYPMVAVFGVPKTKLNDSAFSDDELVGHLLPIFTANYDALPAQGVSSIAYSYNTDAITIWDGEVSNAEHQMLFTLSYIRIYFDISYTIDKNCIVDECSSYGSDSTTRARIYYGSIGSEADPVTPDEGDILAFTSRVRTDFIGSFVFPELLPASKRVIAIPVSFGIPASFTDDLTQLNVPMDTPYQVSVSSVSYNVFETYWYIGGAITINVA